MLRNIVAYFHFLILFLDWVDCDKLLAVTTIVRHGERLGSYGGYYPNDPYLDLRMENPSDELLNLGVEELYNVGTWMRQHYSGFLPLEYNTKDIYVQSIDFDRCLMSAEALLAALYPPVGDEIWNSRLLWQPVPIHTTRDHDDILLQWTACPYYTLHSERAIELRKKILKEDSSFFKFLSEETGSPFKLIDTLVLYNILKGEKLANLTLPIWAHGVIKNIKPLVELGFEVQTMDTRIRKLRSGTLVNRILTQFEGAISGVDFGTADTIYRKLMMYSTADMTVYYLADSLGYENIGIVNYGFSIYFELWQADDGNRFVDVFYRNSTDIDAPSHYTKIKGQSNRISFGDFKEIAGKIRLSISEWKYFCRELLEKSNSTNH